MTGFFLAALRPASPEISDTHPDQQGAGREKAKQDGPVFNLLEAVTEPGDAGAAPGDTATVAPAQAPSVSPTSNKTLSTPVLPAPETIAAARIAAPTDAEPTSADGTSPAVTAQNSGQDKGRSDFVLTLAQTRQPAEQPTRPRSVAPPATPVATDARESPRTAATPSTPTESKSSASGPVTSGSTAHEAAKPLSASAQPHPGPGDEPVAPTPQTRPTDAVDTPRADPLLPRVDASAPRRNDASAGAPIMPQTARPSDATTTPTAGPNPDPAAQTSPASPVNTGPVAAAPRDAAPSGTPAPAVFLRHATTGSENATVKDARVATPAKPASSSILVTPTPEEQAPVPDKVNPGADRPVPTVPTASGSGDSAKVDAPQTGTRERTAPTLAASPASTPVTPTVGEPAPGARPSLLPDAGPDPVQVPTAPLAVVPEPRPARPIGTADSGYVPQARPDATGQPKPGRPVPATSTSSDLENNPVLPEDARHVPEPDAPIPDDAPLAEDRPKAPRLAFLPPATAPATPSPTAAPVTTAGVGGVSAPEVIAAGLSQDGAEQLAGLSAATSTNPGSPTGPAPLTAPPAAQHVVQQVASQIVAQDDGLIEIRLDPPELGRVVLSIQAGDGAGLSTQILVERPETLELLRRHADLLQQALADAGHPGSELDFSGYAEGGLPGEGMGSGPDPDAEIELTASDSAAAWQAYTGGDALDIRL